MTYEEWKSIKAIRSMDNEKVIRNFERRYPMLAAAFEEKEQEEQAKMRNVMEEPNRMERWRQIAKLEDSGREDWKARRRREVM